MPFAIGAASALWGSTARDNLNRVLSLPCPGNDALPLSDQSVLQSEWESSYWARLRLMAAHSLRGQESVAYTDAFMAPVSQSGRYQLTHRALWLRVLIQRSRSNWSSRGGLSHHTGTLLYLRAWFLGLVYSLPAQTGICGLRYWAALFPADRRPS